MNTIEDLPFLRAQAADLERLIRIAPPEAVIEKFQYEERLREVRSEIRTLEQHPVDREEVSSETRSLSDLQRAAKVRFNLASELSQGLLLEEPSSARFLRADGTFVADEQVMAPSWECDSTLAPELIYRDVRSDIELLQSEQVLRTAHQIQMALYPKAAPVLPGFEISGVTHPRKLLGGDYYDYIPMADGTLAVLVGDISGHGLGPALEMVETRASMRAFLSCDCNMTTALSRLNNVLVEDLPSGMFVTLFAMCLDPSNKTIIYSSAGHEAKILTRSDEIVLLPSTGLVLGIQEGAEYPSSSRIQVCTGDLIVLATDGVIEQSRVASIPGTHQELFGWQRTMESIRRNRHRSASEILQQLCQDVRDFAEGVSQGDDATAVVIKVL
jgi:hypothetical protein